MNNQAFQSTKNRLGLVTIESCEDKERFICSKCRDILVGPLQSDCGCRFCSSCINLDNAHLFHCCALALEQVSRHFFYDRAIEKEILCLQMICPNQRCKEKFSCGQLEGHLEACQYAMRTCPRCQERFRPKDLANHKKRDCMMAKTRCNDCGREMTKMHLRSIHKNPKGDIEDICDHFKSVCPHKCSSKVHRSLKDHLRNCPLVTVKCTMEALDCNMMVRRRDMEEHLSVHISLLIKKTKTLESTWQLKLDSLERDLGLLRPVPSCIQSRPLLTRMNDFGESTVNFGFIPRMIHQALRLNLLDPYQVIFVDSSQFPGFPLHLKLTVDYNAQILSLSAAINHSDSNGALYFGPRIFDLKWQRADRRIYYTLPRDIGAINMIFLGEMVLTLPRFLGEYRVDEELTFELEVLHVPVFLDL